jgi:parvulin-like peptidyl-prolyl isomerase
VVSKQGRSADELRARLAQVQAALEKGEDFIQIAQRLSDGGTTPESSLIGIIPIQDMSPTIAEVVSPLRAGQASGPLETPNDIQIFFVEERLGDPGQEEQEVDEDALREEVRQILQKQKTKERLAAYFKNDLYKNHAVDKRL